MCRSSGVHDNSYLGGVTRTSSVVTHIVVAGGENAGYNVGVDDAGYNVGVDDVDENVEGNCCNKSFIKFNYQIDMYYTAQCLVFNSLIL